MLSNPEKAEEHPRECFNTASDTGMGLREMIPSQVDSEEGGGKDSQVGKVKASGTYPKYDTDR